MNGNDDDFQARLDRLRWAVDPRLRSQVSNSNQKNDDYKNYLRVRLPQIVHRDYEARRFHGSNERYSIKALWRVARKELSNQTLLYSLRLGLWKATRNGGIVICREMVYVS